MSAIQKMLLSLLTVAVFCFSFQRVTAAPRSCKALVGLIRASLLKNERLPAVCLTAPAPNPWIYQRESLGPLFDHVDKMGANEVALVSIRKHGLGILIRGEVYVLESDYINRGNDSSRLNARVLRLDRNDPTNHYRLAMHLEPISGWDSLDLAGLMPIGPPVAVVYSAIRRTLSSISFELPNRRMMALRTKLASGERIQIGIEDFEGAEVYDTRVFRGGVNRIPALTITALLGGLLTFATIP